MINPLTNLLGNRIDNDMQRDLKNPTFAFRVYGGIFCIALFVFGFMGIYPLYTVLKTKYLLIKEMKSINTTMQSNYTYAQQAETDLAAYSKQLEYLDEYMPVTTNIQNYVLDFVATVSQSGYVVTEVAQDISTQATEGQLNLTITMEGSGYPIDVIKQIETIKRVTQVNEVKLSYDKDGSAKLNIPLTIYTVLP